jgi:hypothetical protein
MAIILHLAQNMEEELPGIDLTVLACPSSPISAFVAIGRGSHGGRGHNIRGRRGGRGFGRVFGGLNHIMSSCTASHEALVKRFMARKRMMIVWKYKTPGGIAHAHAALKHAFPLTTPMDSPLSTYSL